MIERWETLEAEHGTADHNMALEKGWEPFGVVYVPAESPIAGHGGREGAVRIYLRRRVEVPDER